ncbi:extracellular solute-binding protein [Roseomonas stagni]|uniref:Extracellular solute-binding protein n=1 Tax=Falsiroseomonas algicola TaxID=2716930 RepID=A0A6M1LJN7_9PROT|nr:extracellular solute-binding protein [Falsiroseomonas algicola]NGM20501.1 extracellular solute-binding protein [Falsiroseomonas algicola]
MTLTRRALLPLLLAPPLLPADSARAQPGATRPLNVFAWSAVEPLLRPRIPAFEVATQRRLRLLHLPWAAYREALAARLMGQAEIDICAMSDLWLPEFAHRGWLAPIDDLPGAEAIAAETRPVCNQGMSWQGRRYGVPYYTDSIVFLVNKALLERAGIPAAPETWEEVVEQSLLLQRRGLVRHGLALPLAPDPWLLEVTSALVYAFGGRHVDADLDPTMQQQDRGAVRAMRFLQDALHRHAVLPATARLQSEADVLDGMSEGDFAFCLAPSYRLRQLNDPAQSAVAGAIRMAMMPRGGPRGTQETCGWVRFFAATPGAMASPARRAGVEALLAFLAGQGADGRHETQKRLLLDGGLPFCALPLLEDPEIEAAEDRWSGSSAILRRQAILSRPKDLLAPWLSDWSRATTDDVTSILAGRQTPEEGLARMAEQWSALKAAHA